MKYVLNIPNEPITIVGGGSILNKDLRQCMKWSHSLVAADGGANYIKSQEIIPDFIIGDLDSIQDTAYWKRKGVQLIKIWEQETSDFEKCMYSCNAGYYLCLGFTGRRVDHFLSVCSTVIKYKNKPVILVGSNDIIFQVPKRFEISLPVKTRVSLFPIKRVLGIRSRGLKWPINDIEFDPAGKIGTSNETNEKVMSIEISNSGMLMILPRKYLSILNKYFFRQYGSQRI